MTMFAEMHIDGSDAPSKVNTASMPVLPLRDMVAFPHFPFNVDVERDSSAQLLAEAEADGNAILVVTQSDPSADAPTLRQLYKLGVICHVVKVMTRPDGVTMAILMATKPATITKILKRKPYIKASVEPLDDSFLSDPQSFESTEKPDNSTALAIASVAEQYNKILSMIGEDEARELSFALKQFDGDHYRALAQIASHSPLTLEEKQDLLSCSSLFDFAIRLLKYLNRGEERMKMKLDIQNRTREEMTRQQKEMFMRQELQTLQNELGVIDDFSDIEEFRTKAKDKQWSKEAKEHFFKELKKLERYNISSPDYAIQYSYLESLLALPWNKTKEHNFNLQKAQEILDRDHFGMKDIKDRILEHLAVLKLRGDMKAPILCLYGPPGVGKTSLGKSIAEALGRDYMRIALGGVHDEAEIRGHRRTYISAMPGRIIAALAKCESSNPVFVLDEIDKLGADHKGDPSTALLEVLDPEQNNAFHDNYIDFDYDLSKVLFIATANQISNLSTPLLDRLEVIELSGYTAQEKREIAKRHLFPKVLKEHGFASDEISLSDDAIDLIVENYTRESGVRLLGKKLGKIVRRIAVSKVSGKDFPTHIDKSVATQLLGTEQMLHDTYDNNDYAGVVTGLAWTQTGGEILYVETSVSKSKTADLTLTGQLGDVMKESASIALQYVRANADKLGISPEVFDTSHFHIHVPEGAVPKDGPSAGITMVTSIASAITRRKVRSRLAMTGEMTLRGKVLPVGGLKEKVLAAVRAGITDIMLSDKNRPDIDRLPDYCKEKITFHFVDRVEEVLSFALLKEKAVV